MASDVTTGDRVDESSEIREDLDFENKIIIASIVGAIVGAFLPWASFLGQTVFGIEGDGILTLILALAAGAGVYWRNYSERMLAGLAVVGLLIAMIALFSVTGVADIGVYVTLFAGIALLGGGLSGYRKFD